MLDFLKENVKIDLVWCTLNQFLEIGDSAFHNSRPWAGELGFAPHGVLFAECFCRRDGNPVGFSCLFFTSWGSIMPTPLAKAYSKKEVCIELWIRF